MYLIESYRFGCITWISVIMVVLLVFCGKQSVNSTKDNDVWLNDAFSQSYATDALIQINIKFGC